FPPLPGFAAVPSRVAREARRLRLRTLLSPEQLNLPLRILFQQAQQDTSGSFWLPPPLLPVPERRRLYTDGRRELLLAHMELVAQLHDIDIADLRRRHARLAP